MVSVSDLSSECCNHFYLSLDITMGCLFVELAQVLYLDMSILASGHLATGFLQPKTRSLTYFF